MGTKYTTQSTSGYNSSPPPDDGTQVAANLISWSVVRTKLTDVLKTFGEAINTALVSAFDLSARAISSNDTAVATDHWKTLQVTGTTTITLSSAASMGAGYEVGVFNNGVSAVVVSPSGSDTINGVSSSVSVSIKGTKIFRTNQALTGYNVVGGSDPQTVTATTSVVTPLVTSSSGTISFTPSGGNTLALEASTNALRPGVDQGINLGTSSLRFANTFSLSVDSGASPLSLPAGQLKFPATQSASSDANTLDDYEEGTWTPALGGSATYTTQTGTYTKVGRLVYARCRLVVNSIGTGSTTVISGLPFTSGSTTHGASVGTLTSSATNVVSAYGLILGTTITINCRTVASANDAGSAIFGNSTAIDVSGTYEV